MRIYALKTIRKAHIVDRKEITHTLAERLVLARVSNPFIVPLKFSFQSEQKLYLVLAWVQHNLSQHKSSPLYSVLLMVESYSITCSVNNVSMKNAPVSTVLSYFSPSNISMNWMSYTGTSIILTLEIPFWDHSQRFKAGEYSFGLYWSYCPLWLWSLQAQHEGLWHNQYLLWHTRVSCTRDP